MAEFDQLFAAIAGQESGGNYSAVNSRTGASGKFQIMPANIASWSKQYLGRAVGLAEFRSSPAIQEQVARGRLLDYYNKYGLRGAASAWYSGNPNAHSKYTRFRSNEPSIGEYVDSVLRRMGKVQPSAAAPVPDATGQVSTQTVDNRVKTSAYKSDDIGDIPRALGLTSVSESGVGIETGEGVGSSIGQPMAAPKREIGTVQAPTTQDASQAVSAAPVGASGGAGGMRGAAVASAMQFIGTPYVWGGAAPGGFDCVAEGTLVSTPAGPRPIESIRPFSPVYSWEDGALVERLVLDVTHKGTRDSRTIRLRGRSLTCTDGHGLPVAKKVGRAQWAVEWRRAEDVRRDDMLVVQRELPDLGSEPITPEEAWYLGIHIGDGTLRRNGVAVCVYGDSADRVERFWLERFGARANRRNPSLGVVTASAGLRDWLLGLGVVNGSHLKSVPSVILGAGHKVQEAFLRGYHEADGSTDLRDGALCFHSCNLRLIEQVRHLAMGLGWGVGNLTVNHRGTPIVIKGVAVKKARPLYTFRSRLDLPAGNRTQVNLHGGHRLFKDPHFTMERVLEAGEGPSVDMWDISVDGAENFIAGGVLVHNCSGLLQYSLKKIGISIPRVSQQQDDLGRRIPIANAQPGDLIGFADGGHIAMYVGNGQMIEAPRPGKNVLVTKVRGAFAVDMSAYYKG